MHARIDQLFRRDAPTELAMLARRQEISEVFMVRPTSNSCFVAARYTSASCGAQPIGFHPWLLKSWVRSDLKRYVAKRATWSEGCRAVPKPICGRM